jgi:hypothetical protein
MTDYEYGDQQAEYQHGLRELEQLQLGLTTGVLSQREYRVAAARVRRTYGLDGWGGTHDTNTGP